MNPGNYRLYVDAKQFYCSSFEEAKEAAKEHLSGRPELRIEILQETEGADFWAYEYENNEWVPS